MNQNSAKVQKTSRVALVIARIVQIILVMSILLSLLTYFLPSGVFMPRIENRGDYFITVLLNSVTTVIALGALFVVCRLLQTLKSHYTPFTKENVKRLKIISFLLIAIEPMQMVCGSIANALRSLTANGEKIVTVSSMGGMVIVLGLIVFCVALVFEYGIELQKQSDEML